MERREVEVGDLNRGDKYWWDGLEYEVLYIGNSFIHSISKRGHDYPDLDRVVEVSIPQ